MRTKKIGYVLLAGALVLSLSTMKAKAQDGRFSVGAELGLPMGDFGDVASTGFGLSVRYEKPMGDNLGLMLTAGWLSFSGKDIEIPGYGTISGVNLTMIPIQVGAKYYFQEQQNGLYGMFELGIHSTSSSAEGSESSTDLSYAPGIGYHLANLDLGLKYQMVATEGSTTSYLGLRIAYVLGGK